MQFCIRIDAADPRLDFAALIEWHDQLAGNACLLLFVDANDRIEAAVIAAVLGSDVLVSSTKSLHGHLMGGAGAVELLACLLALQDGVIAPTAGHRMDDPDCRINLVQDAALHIPVNACLSNAFAFGGLNAVLALTRA